MKLLYVLGALQHPSIVRGALRHYHFLRLLAQRNAITLLVLSRDEAPAAAVSDLATIVDRLHVVSVDQPRWDRQRLRVPERLACHARLRRAVRRMRDTFDGLIAAEAFDAIVFHGKAAYPVIAGARSIPTVIDVCDATSLRQRDRLRYARPWSMPWRLAGYLSARYTERRLIRHSQHAVFMSRRDREAILGPHSTAAILPNGIDVRQWTRNGTAPRHNRLVFTGVMNYAPNEDAALVLIREVLPILLRSRPDLTLELVGLGPSETLLRAAETNPAVTITGFVPHIQPHLEEATVYVAPIRYASGLQNKVLEAMAMEVPVVTTPVVAEGLKIGELSPPLLVATSPKHFAAEVLALLENTSEMRRLAREGRRFVETHFDWISGAAFLEQLCEAAVRGGQQPAINARVRA